MKHICVIGNSQVGALRLGYKSLENCNYEASFWTVPGGGGPKISIQSNLLNASEVSLDKLQTDIKPAPKEGLDISNFDAILLSGVGIPAIRKIPGGTGFHSKYAVAGFLPKKAVKGKQILSKEVYSLAVEHALHSIPSFKNISTIESIYKKKIFLQLFPLPTPDIVNQGDFFLGHYGTNVGKYLSWYLTVQSNCIKRHIKNKNISIVGYPTEWLQSGFTPIDYSSHRDAWHLNEDFGRFYMGQLMGQALL